LCDFRRVWKKDGLMGGRFVGKWNGGEEGVMRRGLMGGRGREVDVVGMRL
jgi:hypothetical protein